ALRNHRPAPPTVGGAARPPRRRTGRRLLRPGRQLAHRPRADVQGTPGAWRHARRRGALRRAHPGRAGRPDRRGKVVTDLPQPPHRVPVDGSPWGMWRDVVMRSAGFPADLVLTLTDAALAEAADAAAGDAGQLDDYRREYRAATERDR